MGVDVDSTWDDIFSGSINFCINVLDVQILPYLSNTVILNNKI